MRVPALLGPHPTPERIIAVVLRAEVQRAAAVAHRLASVSVARTRRDLAIGTGEPLLKDPVATSRVAPSGDTRAWPHHSYKRNPDLPTSRWRRACRIHPSHRRRCGGTACPRPGSTSGVLAATATPTSNGCPRTVTSRSRGGSGQRSTPRSRRPTASGNRIRPCPSRQASRCLGSTSPQLGDARAALGRTLRPCCAPGRPKLAGGRPPGR
jgi:hypothetical protein